MTISHLYHAPEKLSIPNDKLPYSFPIPYGRQDLLNPLFWLHIGIILNIRALLKLGMVIVDALLLPVPQNQLSSFGHLLMLRLFLAIVHYVQHYCKY